MQKKEGTDRKVITAKDIPACKEESFATPVHYRRARIRLQLQQADLDLFIPTWNALYQELMVDDQSDEGIRKYLKFQPDWTGILPAAVEDSAAWASAAFSHIQHAFSSGRGYTFFPDQTPKSLMSKQQGTPSELNLLLVATLKAKGFHAYPMLCATRDHEPVQQAYPIIHQFTHLLAVVVIGGKTIVMDASDPYSAWNMIPPDALTYSGWLLGDQQGIWMDITPSQKYDENYMLNLNLTDSLEVSGSCSVSASGYAGYDLRAQLSKDSAQVKETAGFFFGQSAAFTRFDSARVGSLLGCSGPVVFQSQLTSGHSVEETGDLLMVRPVKPASLEKNPFQPVDSRTLPLDMRYPRSLTYSMTVQIPEGYTILEVPKPVKAVLPENGGSLLYKAEQNGNRVVFNFRLQLTQSWYPEVAYDALRNFYDLITRKLDEPVLCQKGE